MGSAGRRARCARPAAPPALAVVRCPSTPRAHPTPRKQADAAAGIQTEPTLVHSPPEIPEWMELWDKVVMVIFSVEYFARFFTVPLVGWEWLVQPQNYKACNSGCPTH